MVELLRGTSGRRVDLLKGTSGRRVDLLNYANRKRIGLSNNISCRIADLLTGATAECTATS